MTSDISGIESALIGPNPPLESPKKITAGAAAA
jgi:hypothetical protein